MEEKMILRGFTPDQKREMLPTENCYMSSSAVYGPKNSMAKSSPRLGVRLMEGIALRDPGKEFLVVQRVQRLDEGAHRACAMISGYGH
ncbi:MAG TPA: hypothetical protein PKM72_01455 [Nitrospirales bacterium]|nr:hypothetical protein [Nitrospiraceae bacterium]HNP59471.1 hypothetical protein [Nitrospirales bacterium]